MRKSMSTYIWVCLKMGLLGHSIAVYHSIPAKCSFKNEHVDQPLDHWILGVPCVAPKNFELNTRLPARA
jgi:hypothetical protein